MESAAKFYSLLCDDKSKLIFKNRLLYSITGERKYLNKIIATNDRCLDFYNAVCEHEEPVILYGLGVWGGKIIDLIGKEKIKCVVDSYKKEGMYDGIPLLSVDALLKKYNDETIIISSRRYHDEIRLQLTSIGISESKIVDAGEVMDCCMDDIYFDLPELKNNEEREVFVDAGCYDASTTLNFIKWAPLNSISYCFEPEDSNYHICNEKLKAYGNRCTIYKYGLWDKSEQLKFDMNSGASSRIVSGYVGNNKNFSTVDCVPLDDIIQEKISYIKMDIEGAEREAILGAKALIEKYEPKMAISVYHKPEDIIKIPELLMSISSNYRFYLRHYSLCEWDTVLYAVPNIGEK